jgi:hypothetical protein
MTDRNRPFSYEVAPPGSPDKFRLTADFITCWVNPPRWIFNIVSRRCVRLDDGYVVAFADTRERCIQACIFRGFYFAVSVAPNFERARGPSVMHDWLYANSEALAARWNCDPADVLHIADHWFLALMRFTGFLLKRSYFAGVRVFGRLFRRLTGGK